MSQQASLNRRLGTDRRMERRATPDRRRNGHTILGCVYGIIHNIYRWTDLPAKNGETNLFKRNWRSWFGHATVASIVTAFGRWLGLHTSFFLPQVGKYVPFVFAFGIGGFYFWREFGVGGNYWSYVKAKRAGHDGESDSVIDFWITLPAIYAMFMLPLVYAVLVALMMATGIYLLSQYEGSNDG